MNDKKCKHLSCNKVYTKENNIIIDINYQCNICGIIITLEKYQKILINNCSWCDGKGIHIDQGELYNCGCKNII